MADIAVILPAAGSGNRMGADVPKAFIPINGKPVLAHTLSRFLELGNIRQIIVPVAGPMLDQATEIISELGDPRVICVEGGRERLYSINNAIAHIGEVDLIAVHDAVRPFITPDDITKVCDEAMKTGAAILAIPSPNTLKESGDAQTIKKTVERSRIWQALTPQVFQKQIFIKAYAKAVKENVFGTDDAFLVESAGYPVKIVEGRRDNIKLTYPEDLTLAKLKLEPQQNMRTGIGYDVHRLKKGRKLVLGGVEISHEKGLDGHSDADVLIHAVIDAVTGALALGDIGSHFPDTDAAFKDIDSRILLRKVMEIADQKGYKVGNVDATVVAEAPKLRPHIDNIRSVLAADLNCDTDLVSVKATTSEKIGFVGRQEGMSAMATVLMVAK